MKKLLSLLLAVLMLLSMAACDTPETPDNPAQSTPSPETPTYKQQNYALNEVADRLKLLSRAFVANNGIACDLVASGIEFDAYVEGNLSFTVSCSEDTYFTVFVDGERLEKRFEVKGGWNDRVIDLGDLGELALRNIRIVKQGESNHSITILKKVEFYGFMATKPKNADLYVEFIGDSITCGYGNLWTEQSADPSNQSGKALYEDGTQSYAYLAAELLRADFSIVSCSGIGIDRGYSNPDGNGYRMLDFYKATSYSRSKTDLYDFATARVPDVVVINLGTNDQDLGSTESAFKAGVKELIQFIRTSYNKDVPIIWAYGMMSDGRYQWAQSVLTEMGGENAKLYSVKLLQNKEGGNGHPSLVAHDIAAQLLVAFMTSKGIVEV